MNVQSIVELLLGEDASTLRPVRQDDQPFIDESVLKVFHGILPDNRLLDYAKYYDAPLSVIAEVDGKPVGVYLLKEGSVLSIRKEYEDKSVWSLVEHEDLDRYKDKRGVEGVALAVNSDFRGTGVGKSLINHPYGLGFDYVWGQALSSLGNISHWTKRRRLVAEAKGPHHVYITLTDT